MRQAVGNKRRLVLLFIFLFSLFSLVIFQFFRIQILEGEKWAKKADAQHRLVVVEPCKRGQFYSNTAIKEGHLISKHPFVIDVLHFHLYVDPQLIPERLRGPITDRLAAFLEAEGVQKIRIREQLEKKSRSRRVALWLTKSLRDEIYSWWSAFARKERVERNAVFFVQDYRRSYPFGSLLGQVLHTIRDERDPKTGRQIAAGGLELIFDSVLQGKEGQRELLRSPRHPLDAGKVVNEPENGADVLLTINHTLQAICEEEIAKAVTKAKAKAGWALLMEPKTGEIFALAQYPAFHPGKYRDYYNDPHLLEHTKVKAVTDVFEPGSTMKPLTLALCLTANKELERMGEPPLFSPFEKVDTHPCRLPGRSAPMKDLRVHPYLNMFLALQKSSNVYMAKMILRVKERMGEEWYRRSLEEIFGFGKRTGVELPSESPGLLPTPGKKNPNGTLEWSAPTPYSLAIGHNLLTNSIQMARAFAILANGGWDVKPTLVKRIVKPLPDGSESVLFDQGASASRRRVLDPDVIRQVVCALKAVTKPGGTSPKGDIFGYTEAGKSATSEKIVAGRYSKRDHFSSFVGFAPVTHPLFVLFVGIDEPEFAYIPGMGKVHHGGQCAAPVFRAIGSRVLHYLGVEPDDPYGYGTNDPRYDPARADWMKEVKALQELYRKWNESGS